MNANTQPALKVVGPEPVFDAWIQHPTPDFLRDPIMASVRRWAGIQEVPKEIPLDFTLGALEAAGVHRAVLSAWWGPRGPMITNEEVADAVAQHPNRFIGAASVDLAHPMEAVRCLRRAVQELGLRALRVLPWLWGLPPDDRRYYPLYAACVDLGIPFCLQVGHAGPLCASEPGRPIPYLDHVALEFPELVIVAGHIGYPWTEEMVALATKYDNVYIDTSAWKPHRYPEPLVRFLKGHGREKVLFGSNYPMILPRDCLKHLGHLQLDSEVRRLFLWENAARIFGTG